MGDTTPLLDSTGTTRQVSVDRVSTRDGAAAAANEEAQLVKVGWGAENDLQSGSIARPVPVRDYGFSAAITAAGGASTASFSVSTTLVAANASRSLLLVSNGHATIGVWLTFGAAAALVGRGFYLPPKASAPFDYSGEVRVIPESGTGGPVGYVEL